MRRWLAVACLLPIVGCVPDLDDTCASDDECTGARVCRSSYCVPPGDGDDATVTPDAQPEGAPPPDAATDGAPPDGAAVDATADAHAPRTPRRPTAPPPTRDRGRRPA
ncbi:MAG: hypothetical protein H6704_03760 [Myxococcales bacterium]|nr:hypothetical protein [Myxococcales bacterium]